MEGADMTTEILPKATKDIQYSMFGGESVNKKRRQPSPRSQEFVGNTLGTIAKTESIPPQKTWTGQPILHALYVRDDLQTVWLTAPRDGLPDQLTDSVMPGDGAASQARPMLRLTAELWKEMRQQMDGLDMRQFDAERRKSIAIKWQLVDDFATAEGWQ